jgi:hypothetical protein
MTLTETVFWSKILSKFAGVFVVLLVVGYYAWLFVLTITRTPDDIFAPDNKCGVLPPLNIEAQAGVVLNSPVYQVDALKPVLPNSSVPRIGYVYAIDIKGETFRTRDIALALARDLAFTAPVIHDAGSTIYQWKNTNLKSTLTFNTNTFNFTYIREPSVLPKVPNLQLPATTYRAPEIAANYLRSLGLFTAEFSEGRSYAYPVNMSQNVPTYANAIEHAQLIRVDFQKTNKLLVYNSVLDTAPYKASTNIDFKAFITEQKQTAQNGIEFTQKVIRRVGKTPTTSNVQVYMRDQSGSPSAGLQQLIYNNWFVEDMPCGTYRIIPPSVIITSLSEGKGVIVYLEEKGGDPLRPSTSQPVKTINLYELELVYYEANEIQPYLQPIYVATGETIFENGSKGDISIYIPAIDYTAQPKK